DKIGSYVKKNGVADRVYYFGEIKPGKELNDFYNLGDAMIFPSKAEGFSLVILEAMSAGIPVIINKKLQFKLAGSCLKYDNENDFCNVVKEYILDEEKHIQMSLSSRKKIEEEYSWDAIAIEYYKACEV
ncbi:MAG: glycosyltransferase family 4 protein, partial [Lachnospiraceae bacterium]|nr:glycosyltransferase family 4 protein [Lachnospiraceae bacterium]